jgi:hypothetical protein
MEQIMEMLKGMQEKADADRKADQKKAEADREEIKRIMDANMKSTIGAIEEKMDA